MKQKIKYFETIQTLAEALVNEFQIAVHNASVKRKFFYTALSGGSTPNLFFQTLAKPENREKVLWQNVHLFWGDERCVPPQDEESNFGTTKRILLDFIDIPQINVHPIHGEKNLFIEVTNYSNEIRKIVPFSKNDLPVFDWIFLGLGSDGHTASIFPVSNVLNKKNTICSVAKHPLTGQERITLTLPAINNAKRISFLVTGEDKAEILKKIVMNENGSEKYPASFVRPKNGILEWYLDKAAGKYLNYPLV